MKAGLFVKTTGYRDVDNAPVTVFRRADSVSSVGVVGPGKLSVRFNGGAELAFMSPEELTTTYSLDEIAEWARRNG